MRPLRVTAWSSSSAPSREKKVDQEDTLCLVLSDGGWVKTESPEWGVHAVVLLVPSTQNVHKPIIYRGVMKFVAFLTLLNCACVMFKRHKQREIHKCKMTSCSAALTVVEVWFSFLLCVVAKQHMPSWCCIPFLLSSFFFFFAILSPSELILAPQLWCQWLLWALGAKISGWRFGLGQCVSCRCRISTTCPLKTPPLSW